MVYPVVHPMVYPVVHPMVHPLVHLRHTLWYTLGTPLWYTLVYMSLPVSWWYMPPGILVGIPPCMYTLVYHPGRYSSLYTLGVPSPCVRYQHGHVRAR